MPLSLTAVLLGMAASEAPTAPPSAAAGAASRPSWSFRRAVSSRLDVLQALHEAFGWIPGAVNIRPTPEVRAEKEAYLQRVAARFRTAEDFILVEVFGCTPEPEAEPVPSADAHEDVVDGGTREPRLVVPHERRPHGEHRFVDNKFPYVLPDGTHHAVLWYCLEASPHGADSTADADGSALPESATVEGHITAALRARLGHDDFDYVCEWDRAPRRLLGESNTVSCPWLLGADYVNPKKTLPSSCHFQVFWTLTTAV